jgi:hypothetical protein
MPLMPGTRLLGKLREHDSSVKAVMLTGRASIDDVSEAIPMKFDHFVKKASVSKLPQIAFDLYLEYLQEAATRLGANTGQLVASQRKYLVLGPRIEYRVAAIAVLDAEYLVESQWRTILKVDAGEEHRYREQRIEGSKFVIEEESRGSLSANFTGPALPLKAFSFKLEQVVDAALKTHFEDSTENLRAAERVYKLPPESLDATKLHITSRHFQRAPVYARVLVRLSRMCLTCGSSVLLPVIVLYPTDKVASRHKDYYSDNSERITNTGIV